jgi:hypothetical protein
MEPDEWGRRRRGEGLERWPEIGTIRGVEEEGKLGDEERENRCLIFCIIKAVN